MRVDPSWARSIRRRPCTGAQDDLHVDLVVTTSIPGNVLKHRLRLLAGSAWELRDVTAA